MYHNYETGEEEWELPPDRDPFVEDPTQETLIGTVQVFLQPLAYMVELKEQLSIVDYRGTEVGFLNVEVVPCSSSGREYTEADDMFLDSPLELLGKDVHFIIKLHACRGLPSRFTDVHCSYRVFLDTQDTRTETISDTQNPEFNHAKRFDYPHATQQLVDYLRDAHITVMIWGKQISSQSSKGPSALSTLSKIGGLFGAPATGRQSTATSRPRSNLQEDLLNQANNLMGGFKMNGRYLDPNKQSIIVELLLMKKHQARQQIRIVSTLSC